MRLCVFTGCIKAKALHVPCDIRHNWTDPSKLDPGNQGKQGRLSFASQAQAQHTRLTPLAQLARLSK